jgi:type IV secretory pathway VirB10-like protein
MKKLLDLKPRPHMSYINPKVFTILCGFLAIVLGVLFYTITEASHIKSSKKAVVTTAPMIEDNEKRWYQNVSDNIARPIASPQSTPEMELSHQETELLKAAKESPIKAPMDNLANQALNRGYTAQEESIQLTDLHSTSEKEYFTHSLPDSADDTLHEPLKKPFSPFVLQAGTLLPATLIGGISSDLPGQLSALVNQNVYDSIAGRYLLVPQGSKLLLMYDANVAYGQKRLLVVVKRLLLPNGRSINLENMPAVDSQGQAGFHDEVDNHYTRIFGNAAMLGVIGGGLQMHDGTNFRENTLSSPTLTQTMSNSITQQMEQVALGMMNKNLDTAPQLVIRPGYQFNVQVTKDLYFNGPY